MLDILSRHVQFLALMLNYDFVVAYTVTLGRGKLGFSSYIYVTSIVGRNISGPMAA